MIATAASGLLAFMAPSPAVVAAPAPTVGVVSSLTEVRPTSPTRGMPQSVNLVAARGETESFQIVIPGPLTVTSVSGNLFGWGTTDFYAARAYTATTPSDREGGTGDWYDALVPAKDRIYGETRNAFPQTVPAGQNRVVWVDVTVPLNAPAGTRSATVTVTTSSGAVAVPVTLRVFALSYPRTASLKSAFFVNYDSGTDDQICLAHTGSATCNGSATTRRMLYSLYSRLALDHRVTLANGSGLHADQSPTAYGAEWERYVEQPTIRGTSVLPAGAKWTLPGAKATSVLTYEYADWHCGAGCVAGWRAEATETKQDWSSEVGYYGCDEPGLSLATWRACAPKASEAVRTWNRPVLVTAAMNQYNANWSASGMPPVSTLAPQITDIHDKVWAGHPNSGDQRASYNSFVAQPGRQFWLYTSCYAAACGGPDPTEDNSSYYDGWPSYAIDAPANQARAMSWMVRRYKASGELNWGVQVRLATAWQAGGLYRDGVNGDGTYFYPGTVARIGGQHDIPLSSIRLARLRDGREDYELMTWLTSHGKGKAVDAIVREAYPTAYSATRLADDTPGSPGALTRARDKLITLVDQVL